VVETSKPCPQDWQVIWDGVITEQDSEPVGGKLDESFEIQGPLIGDQTLSSPDLGESRVVASRSLQKKCMPVRIAGECRQPHYVERCRQQARVAADGITRGGVGPAATGIGADPFVHLFPVAGKFVAELLLGRDPQGLVREQVDTRRRIPLGVAQICGGSRVKTAPEHAAQDGVEFMRRSPGKSRQIASVQTAP
jgi:hypothetical protein